MSAKIVELKNIEEELIYPVTAAKAVWMPDGQTTLYDEFSDYRDDTAHIVFNSDGTIEKTLGSGKKVVTSFETDGSIKDTCTYEDGGVYYVKTTKFNEDGSIDVSIEYTEGA